MVLEIEASTSFRGKGIVSTLKTVRGPLQRFALSVQLLTRAASMRFSPNSDVRYGQIDGSTRWDERTPVWRRLLRAQDNEAKNHSDRN